MTAFDDLFGDPSASTGLTEADLSRVVQRAERRVKFGRPAAGITEVRERAHAQAELARQISEALQARDIVSARFLIEEGARLAAARPLRLQKS